ncbi:glycosyl hydrolase [Zunongwangia sp. F363]|uniref:Glycosyl hydrolase n=1 Tax=Autumnicola tepida TaxID=3075595 RepID=A0ABU3CBP2_9FLAO|nr:glycosyl hydrolase [Zunongwangia sp. F363]MDT0643757.1 glycosyl hydrolase [Zunongwangia sp. F363]
MKKILLIVCSLATTSGFSQSLVNKNATAEARELYMYIANIGDSILAGQHSYNEEPAKYYNKAEEIAGQYPAVWGTDFYWNRKENPGDRIVEAAKQKHKEGAIVTLMWHVGRPTDDAPYGWKESVQNTLSDTEWQELVTPGTALHKRWLEQVDVIAEPLKQLQQANIPVLWRPYHEMNGVWFWWGNKKGPDGYQKLWKQLYERLVNHHKLNNLIWVWNANGPRDIPQDEAYSYKDFYPGRDYVDILATDVYHSDYEQKDYEELLQLADGKPVALGEVGELPKPAILEAQPKWSWFMVWSNWLETANTPERVKEIYNYPKILTRNEIEIHE